MNFGEYSLARNSLLIGLLVFTLVPQQSVLQNQQEWFLAQNLPIASQPFQNEAKDPTLSVFCLGPTPYLFDIISYTSLCSSLIPCSITGLCATLGVQLACSHSSAFAMAFHLEHSSPRLSRVQMLLSSEAIPTRLFKILSHPLYCFIFLYSI